MAPNLPFQSQVILITGAASGIGRATAIKLSSLGASLALCDLNPSGLAETTTLCTTAYPSPTPSPQPIHTATFNIADSSACNAFVAAALAHHGRIDHVFNCAGVNPTAVALVDTDDAHYAALVDASLRGTFNVCRAAVPRLARHASVVNMSSVCGVHAARDMAVYSAAKAAVIALSKALALELGEKGVRVNVVAPGYIDTPTNASVKVGAEKVRSDAARVPLGRLGRSEEVADVVVWLMGTGSGYVSGSVVEVNGGLGFGC